MLRDLRRTADILRESGSAKNFEDITEQDWPDGDLNSTAGDMESNQETSKSQSGSTERARRADTGNALFASAGTSVEIDTTQSDYGTTCKTATHRRASVSITIANANSIHSTFTTHR